MSNKICIECEAEFKKNDEIGNINGPENLCKDCREKHIENKKKNQIFFNQQKEFNLCLN